MKITPDIIEKHGIKPDEYKKILSLIKKEPNLINTCFDNADLVGITSVFSAGEKEIQGINSRVLVEQIRKKGRVSPTLIDDEPYFHDFLNKNCKKGDIFLCLGAGSISSWINKLKYLKSEPKK